MRRLSASSTYVYKRAFPVFWAVELGGLVLFIGMAIFNPTARPSYAQWVSVGFPFLIISVVSVFIFKTMIADLVDEVWLDNDQLLVKNRGAQTSVALVDVMNVNTTSMSNPRRVTLMLRVESRLGRNLTFIPDSPRGFAAAFTIDPIAAEVIARVDALRQVRR